MQFIHELVGTQAGLVLSFLAAAAVVVLAGVRLSYYGNALGDRTGLGGGLVGLFFLAGITSLPEVVVSLTAILQSADPQQGADLATGNMLGSNAFNLLILALMALLFPVRFDPRKIDDPHTGAILYGLAMLGVFAIAFATANLVAMPVPVLGCSWPVLALPVVYTLILRREHRRHSAQQGEEARLPAEARLARLPALRFYGVLALLCALIVGGGILLSSLGARMALSPEQGGFGLEASLIGTLFLAVSTSLPELVISFASVRMGFLAMAVGNVLGSNLFNLLIVFLADTALRGHSLLRQAAPRHWASVGLIALLTLMAGLLLRSRSRAAALSIAAAMAGCYLAALWLLY